MQCFFWHVPCRQQNEGTICSRKLAHFFDMIWRCAGVQAVCERAAEPLLVDAQQARRQALELQQLPHRRYSGLYLCSTHCDLSLCLHGGLPQAVSDCCHVSAVMCLRTCSGCPSLCGQQRCTTMPHRSDARSFDAAVRPVGDLLTVPRPRHAGARRHRGHPRAHPL